MQDSYPLHLLPAQGSKIISSLDLDIAHHLGKWVNDDTLLRNEDGKLNPEAIEVRRIPGFSTNKIPDSVPSDLNISIKKEFSNLYESDWAEGQDGLQPDKNHFEIIDSRNHYFIKISDINNFIDQYENPPGDSKIIYNFTVNVIHRPLISNYWHFELKITSPGHIIVDTNAKWKKLICSSIRDRIQEKAVFEI